VVFLVIGVWAILTSRFPLFGVMLMGTSVLGGVSLWIFWNVWKSRRTWLDVTVQLRPSQSPQPTPSVG
jgi:hypothetical protein